MRNQINEQRRKLLKLSGLCALAAAYPEISLSRSNVITNKASANFKADVEIELKLEVKHISILKGPKTRVWKVQGKLLKGPERTVENLKGTYLGPTLHLHKGQKVRIYLRNMLPAESILHWHGLHVPANMDGNPSYAINQNETYIYEFEILNRAGTYWYHSHAHSVTAKQVYSGLAGLMIVSDKQEQALNLPRDEQDIPIVIQDRNFNNQNQLVYSAHMMQRMQGFLGDQLLINGQPNFELAVATRAYRLRLLNGSNSRLYKLAWDDGSPITVIGNDGGLLEKPEQYPYVMLAPAERLEIWVDFKDRHIGESLALRSIPFAAQTHGGMMGGRGMMGNRGGMMGRRGMMGGGMMGGSSLPLGSDYQVMKVRVVKKVTSNDQLPKRLSKITALKPKHAENFGNTRTIKLSMRHMSALLNGRSYKMNDIKPDEIIPVNTLQLITFDNGFHRSHGMMSMPHPMHLHGEQFQIVKREFNASSAYQSVAKGFVDKGWKDTVLVMPGEQVTILKPFNDFKGLFMYHCHNLEHEDMGMMRDFLIS
jgi:suppressor of ftsI